MLVKKKIMEFFLFLTYFNSFISILNDDSNNKLLLNPEITDNCIVNISLTEGENTILNLYNKGESKKVYFSILKYNDTEVNMSSNIDGYENKILEKSAIQFEYNTSNLIGQQPYINLTYKNTNLIEIISVEDKNIYKYKNITDKDGSNIKVDTNNFVVFLDKKEEKINVEIKLKESLNNNYSYGIVLLPTNNINYIPTAFNFKEKNESKVEDNSIKIELKNNYMEYEGNNKYIAFIFSLNESKLYNYEVKITTIITDNSMNIFLIVSICLALVFAVITFFLIRRKQNISGSNGDNLYNNIEKKSEN